MDIKHVTIPSEDPNAEGDDLLIVVDDVQGQGTVIKVENYGTGEYRWRVGNTNKANDDYRPELIVGEVLNMAPPWNAAQSFGLLATWWEPKTWAHAVMNVINNQ